MMASNRPTVSREKERRTAKLMGQATFADVLCRDDDVEPTKGLHSVAILFRIMAGTLLLIMVLQVVFGLTSTIEISYGVLFAEAIRLVIFAGLLWGAGDLSELFVKSHCDLRATRILFARLTGLMDQPPVARRAQRPGRGDARPGRGDASHG